MNEEGVCRTPGLWRVTPLLQTWDMEKKTLSVPAHSFSKHRPSGPMLSISGNVRLSVCLSVRLCVCLFTFEVPFNGLFAPTSRSRMSNIFRDWESLGKSNGKKWSNIWTFLFGCGLKSPRKKKKKKSSDFALQNMLETTLPDGLETSGRRAYR